MRRSLAALALATTLLAGCPLFRSSASPEEACGKAAAIMDRCATTESPKWDEAAKGACVATVRAFAATPQGSDGFMASQLRDCDAAVNRPAPSCPEQVSCVKERLASMGERAHTPAK